MVIDTPQKFNNKFSRFVAENCWLLDDFTYQNVNSLIHISLKNKFVYFEIPKNACTSIKHMLQSLEFDLPINNSVEFNDVHNRFLSPLLEPLQVPSFKTILNDPNFFVFTVFRHPVERLVSCFLDRVVNNGIWKSDIRECIGESEKYEIVFDDFIYWISNMQISDMDAHYKPQASLSFINKINRINIYRFDRLDKLRSEFATHVNVPDLILPRVTPHKTTSTALPTNVSSWADNLIRNKFSNDFAVWDSL